MPEVTQCPQCQRKLNVQETQLGQTVQCPVCSTLFTAAVLHVQRAPTRRRRATTPRRDDEPPRPRDYDDRRPGYPNDYRPAAAPSATPMRSRSPTAAA